MTAGDRPATYEELDAVKKELVSLERRLSAIVNDLNNTLRNSHESDQRLQATMQAADAAQRRTERLDVAMLLRLQTVDISLLLAVLSAWPRLRQSVDKLEQSVAKLQRDAGRH